MSRSRRHNPIFGNAVASSEKLNKREANKKLRRRVREVLYKNPDTDVLPVLREVSNVYSFAKDGKHYWPKATKKDMAK